MLPVNYAVFKRRILPALAKNSRRQLTAVLKVRASMEGGGLLRLLLGFYHSTGKFDLNSSLAINEHFTLKEIRTGEYFF